MSGNIPPPPQMSGTPGVFRTPAQQQTSRRISDQFTPGTGLRPPPMSQQQTQTGQSTPASSVAVRFASTVTGGGSAGGSGQQGQNVSAAQFFSGGGNTGAQGGTGVGQQQQQPAGGRQSSKFVRAADVDDADMLDVDVALQKENYGEPGSSDYRKNMAMATAALPEKFGVAKHKLVSTGEEGDETKYQHVQQTIVGILHRIKEGHQRSRKMDFMDVCMVADYSGDIENTDCATWWGELEINIWVDWELLTEQQVRAWQYSVNKRFSDGDRIASTWLREFVYNSSTDSLRSIVEKKYDKLPSNQRGGVTYLYYTLCEMFHMSREVKDAMVKFLDLFKRRGVARYTGENVMVVQEELVGVCKRLDSVQALQDDHVFDVLTGLTICGNARFKEMFQFLKQSADLGHLNVLETITPTSTPMEKIEAILDKAVETYDMLCIAGTYLPNTPKGGRLNSIVKAVSECWNCGEKGHGVGKCPHPKDQAKIAKNKKAWEESKSSRGGNSNSGKGRGKKGGNASDAESQRKLWEANNLHFVNGVLMASCKTCGLNTTHTTKTHDEWTANPTSFKLPSTHLYTKECAKLGQRQQSSNSPPPPSSGPTPSDSASGSASSMVSFERSVLESKLTNYERTSTDPNASSVSEAIRALLLN